MRDEYGHFSRVMPIFLVLLASMPEIPFIIQPARAEWVGGTIYIKADGSIEPKDAPISVSGYITYTLTEDIQITSGSGIVVERDSIILNGNGHTITGPGDRIGVFLYKSSKVTVRNMMIRNFDAGILIYLSSSGITISGNSITNSTEYGIWIYSSSGKIFHNSFIDNTIQVKASYSSSYVWDDGYPSGGNYWSDYVGVDVNNDGIGDTQYIIDKNNIDYYPLMKPIRIVNFYIYDETGNSVSDATLNFRGEIYSHGSSTSVIASSYSLSANTIPSGYRFKQWEASGNVNIASPVSSLTTATVSGSGSIVMRLQRTTTTLTIYVYRSGTSMGIKGVIVKVDEVSYTTDSDGRVYMTVSYGSHTVEVVSPYSPSSEIRYVFTEWSDGSTSNPRTISVSSDKISIAYMKLQYFLAVFSLHGSVSPGSGWFDSGENVTLTVDSPVVGFLIQHVFEGWSGDVQSDAPRVTVLMDGPKTVIARWRADYTQLCVMLIILGSLFMVTLVRYAHNRGMKRIKEIVPYILKDASISGRVDFEGLAKKYKIKPKIIEEIIRDHHVKGLLKGSFTTDGKGYITVEKYGKRSKRK